MVSALIKRIQSGEATAQEFEVARKFLADNNINAEPKTGPLLDGLESLPFDIENINTEEVLN